ncbi:DNA polymerase IV [Tersicoccus solisilvae]|uniref:DNA polymerase IV n=1 Tax=Tersicoccus solisilvae TaxID=1882339 RepID=A0ABQ1PCN1_9MICC|nr:DNA polymerase IV [Tersicoccus solisilvae]GGC94628.1 DNA polymerase IV [Tersicoccus solisilvae]
MEQGGGPARAASSDGARGSVILHVDMDAFYVSVEELDDPSLRGREVLVGHASPRSVVLSASYEARAYGVRSAMPVGAALRLCPQVRIVEPSMEKYRRMSARVMAVFAEVTDLVEQVSVDEAFLDVGGAVRRLGEPWQIARLLRERIRAELGLPATVGIAGTKFVAKIASTQAKPDGLLLIPAEHTVAFLHSLPVTALWGVGEKTRQVLARAGISTVAQLAATPVETMRRMLGATGEHVHRLAWGIDPRAVTPNRVEKSIGAEETFAVDVADDARLEAELLRLAHRTAARLRAARLQSRTVSIKVRYSDFTTLTRSHSMTEAVDSAARLHAVAVALLRALGRRPMPVRLIGLRAESLTDATGAAEQLSIDRRENNWRSAERTLDDVHRRFGSTAVGPARLLTGPEVARRTNGTAPDQPSGLNGERPADDAEFAAPGRRDASRRRYPHGP